MFMHVHFEDDIDVFDEYSIKILSFENYNFASSMSVQHTRTSLGTVLRDMTCAIILTKTCVNNN